MQIATSIDDVRRGQRDKLAIDFEEAGDKKVMDAFVERA